MLFCLSKITILTVPAAVVKLTLKSSSLPLCPAGIGNPAKIKVSFVTELGESLKGISAGGFDPIKFFTDNPLIGGIGIGGLLVGGVVLLLVLR